MSRVGKKPIKLPAKVQVTTVGDRLVVEGPLGRLEEKLPEGVTVTVTDGIVNVIAPATRNRHNSGFQGLVRAILARAVLGVVTAWRRDLEINGVGYKAELSGDKLTVDTGYSHKVILKVPAGVKVTLDKSQTKIGLSCSDLQLLGQFAAQVRGVKEPEPYKGKGIKYADETVRRKVGKAGTK